MSIYQSTCIFAQARDVSAACTNRLETRGRVQQQQTQEADIFAGSRNKYYLHKGRSLPQHFYYLLALVEQYFPLAPFYIYKIEYMGEAIIAIDTDVVTSTIW